MLPTFLGIGAPKAGTTWLYELLSSHPDVQMSQHRKEVHYFDRHFDRGQTWYENYFPDVPGPPPVAVGEFTTHYLYDSLVPARVRSVPSIDRFVLILRNPVDQAFSHYRFRRRQDNLTMSFEEYVAQEPAALELGKYGRHLAPWLNQFSPDQFLVLIFERAVRDPDAMKTQLCQHLGIRPGCFSAPVKSANEAFVPRRSGLYGGAVRVGRTLRRLELDRLITLAKRSGVVDLVKTPKATPAEELEPLLRRRLWEEFAPDVALLEDLTGVDVSIWQEGLDQAPRLP